MTDGPSQIPNAVSTTMTDPKITNFLPHFRRKYSPRSIKTGILLDSPGEFFKLAVFMS
jgi:hypothetical protein